MANAIQRMIAGLFGVWDWPDNWTPDDLHPDDPGTAHRWDYTIPYDQRWQLLQVHWVYQNSALSGAIYMYLAAYRGNNQILISPAKAGQAAGNTFHYTMGEDMLRFSTSAINGYITDPFGPNWYLLPGDRIAIFPNTSNALDQLRDIHVYFKKWQIRNPSTPEPV